MINFKIVSAIRNEIASHLEIESLQEIFATTGKHILRTFMCVHLSMTGATCYESHMRFSTSMKLLRKSIEWLYSHICQHCRDFGIRLPCNKYLDGRESYLSYCKKIKRKVLRIRMIKHCMIRLLEKIINQRECIHSRYGTSLRYIQDYRKCFL